MERIDPYKHKERYHRWKHEQDGELPGVSDANARLIRDFLFDMEVGLNISRGSKRGPRSFIRLNTLKNHMTMIARWFAVHAGVTDLAKVRESDAVRVFGNVRSGVIKRKDGQAYVGAGDFVKDFKAFWHWHMERMRKAGTKIEDVAYHLDARNKKPMWVYLTERQVRQLCDEAKYNYRVLMLFLLDSGVRSPSELVNLRVCDFSEEFQKLHIRDEISKTFGRRINLLVSPELVREYVGRQGLSGTDVIFPISPSVTNRYLKRLASRILGTGRSQAGEHYSNLTLYDFRHISACYWLPRYKSESALKYRFGWKQTDRIHYYTELLGMKDTITEDDLMVDTSRTQIEQQLKNSDRECELLKEQLAVLQTQLAKNNRIMYELGRKVTSHAAAS